MMSEHQPEETGSIAENIRRIRERIRIAAGRAGREPESVCLIGVTKRQSVEKIAAALDAGISDFGENYIQEARPKIAEVTKLQEITGKPVQWHLIGHLQSNKAKYTVELFSLIHSVDSYQLAQELSRQAAKRNLRQPVLLEVNLAREAQRAGVEPEAVESLAEQVTNLPNLDLRGLMGIAPITGTAEEARPCFRRLYRLWQLLPPDNRRILSMGMSGDFEVAIEEGATHIRLGTALFGKRTSAQDG